MRDEADYQIIKEEASCLKETIKAYNSKIIELEDKQLVQAQIIENLNNVIYHLEKAVNLSESELSGLKKRIKELEVENDDYEVALESMTIERDEAQEELGDIKARFEL